MRRALLAALAMAVAAAGGGLAAASPGNGSPTAPCYETVPGASTLNTPQRLPCRVLDQADRQAGASCRIVVTDGSCDQVDGRDISAASVAAYQKSWTHRALTLQRQLDESAPILQTQIVHTHNSFNSSAYSLNGAQRPSYYPTLTNQDANQAYSLTDQLNMDVRFVELDLHWVPSPYGNVSTHGYWVTLCHGDGRQAPVTGTWVHVGCTADRPAEDGFAELRRWLDAHPTEFVFVYLENQLYDAAPIASQQQAHDVAATLIQQQLGPLVYRPSGASPGHCADVPYALSVRQLRAHGARVLLLGNCGPGANWSQWVFQRGKLWDESGNPTTYSDSACSHDIAARATGASFRRFFEESTVVATAEQSTSQITAATTAAMVRCGVNIIGVDQLTPSDPRLPALVWSWAPGQPAQGQPAQGGCAQMQMSPGSRFVAADCARAGEYLCRLPNGGFALAGYGPWWLGDDACAYAFGGTFAVPRNGFEADQASRLTLPAITGVIGYKPRPRPTTLWVAYGNIDGDWQNVEGTRISNRRTHKAPSGGAAGATGHDRAVLA